MSNVLFTKIVVYIMLPIEAIPDGIEDGPLDKHVREFVEDINDIEIPGLHNIPGADIRAREEV